uniref:F-box protein AT5G49610-like beta-propeller domain-containing protein n=1 Tax=Aegilops tauschii TaxID=37682 RepID=N1R241_AEGTA
MSSNVPRPRCLCCKKGHKERMLVGCNADWAIEDRCRWLSGRFLYVIWNAWKERNPKIFNETRRTYIEVANLAPKDIQKHELAFGVHGHGLAMANMVIEFLSNFKIRILVWDPVTTDQHRIAVPPGFASDKGFILITAAVLRASVDVHFQVALAVVDREHRRALACVYSSETGEWSDIIWTPLPSEASAGNLFFTERPAVLVGHSLYWLLVGNMIGFLEFDLKRQSLTMIRIPVDLFTKGTFDICAMRAEDGGLGFLFLLHTDHSIQLWKRRTECHGAASWVLGRTIELDKLIPLNLVDKWPFMILGFAEDNNVVFLWTSGVFFMIHLGSLQFKQLSEAEDNNVVFLWTSGVFFMIHLGSLQFKQLSEAEFIFYCHPFESVYTAARRWAAIGLL